MSKGVKIWASLPSPNSISYFSFNNSSILFVGIYIKFKGRKLIKINGKNSACWGLDDYILGNVCSLKKYFMHLFTNRDYLVILIFIKLQVI